jgi:hypothetical protein
MILRKKLKEIDGIRTTFKGTFSRLGKKSRYKPKLVGDQWIDFDTTVLLLNVTDKEGKPVCDHLWMNFTRGFEALGELNEGNLIIFDGRVKPYEKGYLNEREWVDNREIDYKLSHPTKIRRG